MTAPSDTVSLALPPPILGRPTAESSIHPLFHAGKWLIADLLSTLLFVGLYAITHNIYAATGLAIAVGVGQIGYLKARRSRIDAMQWLSLALVVVFGGAALFTRDARFVMFKPTLIYVAVGAVMLKPGWMTRYMPPVVVDWCRDVITVFGYLWAAMMFLTAAANLMIVMQGDPKAWAWFIGVVPLVSKLALFSVQYATTRVIVRKRVLAAASQVTILS